VSPESALLAAVIIAICAAISAGSAVLIVRATGRYRRLLALRREELGHAEVEVSHVAADARDGMARVVVAAERMREEEASWDDELRRLTHVLQEQRANIEGMTRGRLARIIRVAHMVSKAAQFAFLWR
jgi:leucyl aminopeptidase (aminopeptidase T)